MKIFSKDILLKKKSNVYQQVEWIQSVGQIYINTGVIPSNSTKIEIKYRLYCDSRYNSVFGSQDNYNFFSNRGSGANTTYNWYNNLSTTIGEFTQNNYNISIFDVSNGLISNYNNETGITNSSSVSFTNFPSIPMYVFARNNRGTPTYASEGMRLWYFKIWEGNTLIKNFVPCYHKITNEIGLYDLVNNEFYAKTGGWGSFIKPETFSDFQRVEWIGNTGGSYIDTGLLATTGFKMETSLYITNWYGNNNACYFSGILTSNTYRDYVTLYRQKLMLGMNTDTQASITCNLNNWYDIEASTITGNGYLKLDGTNIITSSNAVSHNSFDIWLFGVNYNNSGKFWNAYCRLKETKLYNSSNELVRNLIPCYRKSDGEIGMYDLINNVFYKNQGTDTFTKGADVN